MPTPDPNRRARLSLDLDVIRQIMRLPDDVHLASLVPTFDPFRLTAVVTCDRFPEVDPMAESPHLGLGAKIDYYDVDGRRYVSLEFPGLAE